MRSSMISIAVLLAIFTVAPSLARGDDIDFQRQVWPILESSCVECHGPPRKDSRGKLKGPKAGLRLDGAGYIQRGSDTSNEVVVPGAPEKSLLYKLTSLPPDDLDVMPSKGDPLTAEQLEIIRRWIVEGASFGDWKGTGGPASAKVEKAPATGRSAVPPSETLATLRALGADLEALAPKQLEGLCGGLARVEPVFPGSPLLRIAFTSHQRKVKDAHLAELKPVASHIANLDLGRTGITDGGLRSLGTLPRLVRLNLRGTKVSDDGLKGLRDQPELRSLILQDTAGVTDASAPVLSALPKLTDLYLWGTKITPAGIEEIRTARPAAKIRGAPSFPEPAEEGPRRGRRRRG